MEFFGIFQNSYEYDEYDEYDEDEEYAEQTQPFSR